MPCGFQSPYWHASLSVPPASAISKLTHRMYAIVVSSAFSDIIGAAVERFKGGKAEELVWEIGEDLNVVDNKVGFRNMADPMKRKNPDFYFERYRGYDDNGGVHWNSGIVHLCVSSIFCCCCVWCLHVRRACCCPFETNAPLSTSTHRFCSPSILL